MKILSKSSFRGLCFLMISSLTAFSCAKMVESPSASETDGVKMQISVSTESTKTINDGTSTQWTTGDAISLVHNSPSAAAFVADKFDYTSGNSFTGVAHKTKSVNNWYGFYPYDANNTDPSKFGFTINAYPTQTGNSTKYHLAGEGFPIFGKNLSVDYTPSISLSMNNVLATVDFKVTNKHSASIIVKSIDFVSTSNITGPFTGDFTKESFAFTSKSGASKKVSLTVSDGTAIGSNQNAEFFAGILPHSVPANGVLRFKITARVGSSDIVCYVDKTISAGTSFTGNSIKTINLEYDTNHQTTEDPEPFTPTGKKYIKLTSAPSDWSGTYLFVYENSSKAFDVYSTSTSTHSVDVTINSGTITATDAVNKYALTVNSTGATHTSVGKPSYDVQNSNGKYIFYSDGSIRISDTDKLEKSSYGEVTYNHCLSYENNSVQIISSGNYKSFTKYYLKYSDSKFNYDKTEGQNLQLYRLEGSEGKQRQSLSFDSSEIEWKLGTTYKVGSSYAFPQTVKGAQTNVTYTSSDATVATIESGSKIKIVGAGTTTITATAAASDTYYSASCSYSLTIAQEGAYNLENDKVKAYLDKVASNPYDVSDYSYTYVTDYSKGTSSSNRLDCPKPVSLSWTGSNASKITVYTNASMTTEEWSQTVSGNSADIYNLVPGNTYYYKVTNSSNGEVAKGQFSTTGRRRMIRAGSGTTSSHANNCRDFGGQVTTSGKTIKYKKIYRGTNITSLTTEEKSLLKDYLKIGLEVDLTGGSKNPLGVTVSKQSYGGFSDLTIVSRISATLQDIFDAVNEGTVVYDHCAVGADRTGYVSMLLEAILGVPQERCDIDYELTSFSSAVGTRSRKSNDSSNKCYSKSDVGVHFINKQSGSTFQEKAVNYVVNTLGISKSDVTKFQNNMLN